jgi:hypothetical protein
MTAGRIISTGADGRLVGMTATDLEAVVDAAAASPRVVVYFHGGMIGEQVGRRIATNLEPVFTEAGAYPVFFVWRSGAAEIIRGNLLVGKVEGAVLGGRGGGPADDERVKDELAARRRHTAPEAGEEPFAGLEPGGAAGGRGGVDAEAFTLTADEERQFLAEVESNAGLTRAAAAEAPVELAPVAPDGSRGLISTALLAKKALQALRAVLARYRNQTDSGVYPTVVEEILRAFYLSEVGGALWEAMKQETSDTFAPTATDRGGGLFLKRLASRMGDGAAPRITLVGHSTGAVFIDHLLTTVARERTADATVWPQDLQFQVAYLAPACTTRHFAQALDSAGSLVGAGGSVAAGGLVGRFRMFALTDAAERADRLVGAVYPRSLLYLVSGLLERDENGSAVAPLLGLARYLAPEGVDRLLTSPLGAGAGLSAVRDFCSATWADGGPRVVLSPTAAGAAAGVGASSTTHGGFDDDPLVRASLQELIRTW